MSPSPIDSAYNNLLTFLEVHEDDVDVSMIHSAMSFLDEDKKVSEGTTCMFKCDHCGAKAPGTKRNGFGWNKPHKWYARTDLKTKQTFVACSRKCTEALGGLHAPW